MSTTTDKETIPTATQPQLMSSSTDKETIATVTQPQLMSTTTDKETIDTSTQETIEKIYVFVTNPPVGPTPLPMTCPHCHQPIVTEILHNPSARTHTACFLFSLLGCILCAPYVYCTDECRQKDHWCPICKNYLGSYDG